MKNTMVEALSSIGSLSTRTFWGLNGVLVSFGLLLLALNGPVSEFRSLRASMFVMQWLPLVIAVFLYVRLYSTVTVAEVIGVTFWGYVAITTAGVLGFFLFADLSGGGYVGPTQEMVRGIVHFFAATAIVGGLYAVAASVRDRPFITGLVLLLVPFGRVVVYAAV